MSFSIILGILGVLGGLSGCREKQLSSPWNELGFPLRGEGVESGTTNDASRLNLECDGMSIGPLFTKHAEAFKHAGYSAQELTHTDSSIYYKFTRGTQVISFMMGGRDSRCYVSAHTE